LFKKIFFLIMALLLCLSFASCKKKSELQKFTEYSFDYFDTVTSVIGYEKNREDFDSVYKEIMSILKEYHSLYNIYNKYDFNNLCTVNLSKSTAVKVDKKIIDLLSFSKEMYTLTSGKTNIAMGSVLSIWHYYRQEGLNNPIKAKLPPMNTLTEAAEHTDINDVIIDSENNTVLLSDNQMRLDVGAVAKGYVVERVAEFLEQKGKDGYLINLGGNVRAIGKKDGKTGWKVGIENPDPNAEEAYVTYLEIADMSVVTSGNYQRFYTVDGVNYHHIIDPVTLMPSDKFSSVTVVCKDSGIADALSTALFLMNQEDGQKLLDKYNAVAMWIDADQNLYYSHGFKEIIRT